jgi:hypothetical protein
LVGDWRQRLLVVFVTDLDGERPEGFGSIWRLDATAALCVARD